MFVVFLQRRTQFRLMASLVVVLAAAALRFGVLASQEAWQARAGLLPIRRVDTDRSMVGISFDLEQGQDNVAALLTILSQHGVRATFFINGNWASQYPELVERIETGQHEIANGGYWQEKLPPLGPERVTESIRATHQALGTAIAAEPTPLFRPPGGYCSSMVVETALQEGHHTVLWSLDSRDRNSRNAKRTIDLVKQKTRPGDIIRFSADDAGHPAGEILQGVIMALTERGFKLLPVGTLLRQEGN